MPTLKDLLSHPGTSHTLQNLACILTEALHVTSAYILDWNPHQGTSTVLADYITPQANNKEKKSDLDHTYNMVEMGLVNTDWLENGQIIVEHLDEVDDKSPLLNTRFHLEQYGGQSVLGIPLVLSQQVVGFVELWESRQRRDFTEQDIQLCQIIIQQVGLALENVQLLEAQREQLKLAQVLHEIGALLTTDITLEQVYERIFDLLQQVIPFDGASIQLAQNNTQLYPVAAAGILNLAQLRHLAPHFPIQIIQKRWQEYPSAVIPDTQNDPNWILIPELDNIRSWAGAALYVKDSFIGLLDLCSVHTNGYTQADAKLLLTFANQAAIAIENARLFAETRRQAQELTSLHETALASGERFGISTLLAKVHQQVKQLINPDGFYVGLYDEQADDVIFYEFTESGKPVAEVPTGRRFPMNGLTGWVIRNRRTLFIRDLLEESPPATPIIVNTLMRTWLGVPMIVRERVIGLISIQAIDAYVFQDTDQRFVESLANQLAITLDNVSLFAEEARRRREAEMLNELSASLTNSLEFDDLLQKAVTLVSTHVPDIHNVSITILDEKTHCLQPRAVWVAAPEYDLNPSGINIPLEDTHASRQAIMTRSIVIVADTQNDTATMESSSSYMKTMLAAGVRAILYVPILVQGKPVGILHLDVWHRPRQFRQEEIAFCQGVAYQVAVAYEITRLFAAERRQLHLARTLQQVGSLLTTSLTLDEVYKQLFELLQQVIGFDAAAIFHLEESGQVRCAAAVGNWPAQAYPNPNTFSPKMRQMWQEQPVTVISDLNHTPIWKATALTGMQSFIGAALLVKGDLIGTLNIYSQRKNAYNMTDGELIASFANQAAIAIINTRLHEEIKQGVNELTVMYKIAQLVVSMTDADELLHHTTKFLAERLYPHIFGFLLLDEKEQQIILHSSFHGISDSLPKDPISIRGNVVGHVIRTGHWYIVHDTEQDSYHKSTFPNTESEISVPLKVGGRTIGVVHAASRHKGAYTERDIRFLTTIASQIAAAMERIQIHQHLADLVAERTVELQQEQDRLTTILDGAGEGIFFTDEGGNILYANRASLQITGLQADSVMGQHLLKLPNLQIANGTEEMLLQALRQGKSWHGELGIRTQEDRHLDIRLSLTPLYNMEYGLTGFIGIQSDISRLKEIERLKSEFISNVSHELRTPLTNIMTSTTLLERGKPEKREHYLNVLRSEANRLSRLVNSLLDLSWLETGESIPFLQPIDLRQLLTAILEGFSYTAQTRHLSLSQYFPLSLPAIQADVKQMELAFRNLLENAFAYTGVNGCITVSAELVETHQGQMVQVNIKDDGIGIPQDEQSRLFERFFRGRASLTLGVPGTGLGLPIARHIIEQHNGWIAIKSIAEEGTLVSVWLPPARNNHVS